jgi:hypothetical protein
VEAIAWTAIGMLGASSLGTMLWLGSLIMGLSGRMDSMSARMDSMSARMEAGFAAVNARLDAHIERHAS